MKHDKTVKPQHTPGPWHYDGEDWPLVINCPEECPDEAAKNGHPWYIAEIRLPEGSTGIDAIGDQAAANARLIVLAPDLATLARRVAAEPCGCRITMPTAKNCIHVAAGELLEKL